MCKNPALTAPPKSFIRYPATMRVYISNILKGEMGSNPSARFTLTPFRSKATYPRDLKRLNKFPFLTHTLLIQKRTQRRTHRCLHCKTI